MSLVERKYQAVVSFNRDLTKADDRERLKNHFEKAPTTSAWKCDVTALEDTHAICEVTIAPDDARSDNIGASVIQRQLSRARIKYNKWIKNTYDPVTHKVRTETANDRPTEAPEDLEPRHKRGKRGWLWKWTETFDNHPGTLGFDTYIRTIDARPSPEEWLETVGSNKPPKIQH